MSAAGASPRTPLDPTGANYRTPPDLLAGFQGAASRQAMEGEKGRRKKKEKGRG